MPAQRRRIKRKISFRSRKLYSRNIPRKTGKKTWLLITALLMVAMAAFLIYLFTFRTWVGDSKLSLVINDEANIVVAVFDPKLGDINIVEIPGKVEVDVSRRLGKWKLESIWQLGENEGLEGRLLSETVIKNFKIPVNAWADKNALGYVTKGNILNATFGRYKSNLTLMDKIRLFFFSTGVKEFKRNYIKLKDTSFLKEKRLKDGEMGYTLTENIPQKLIVIAVDEYISAKNLRILLVNESGNFQLSNELGEIIQAMGVKIAAIEQHDESNLDCQIMAKDKEVSRRMAKIFDCEMVGKLPSGNFDVEIKFGKKFFERF